MLNLEVRKLTTSHLNGLMWRGTNTRAHDIVQSGGEIPFASMQDAATAIQSEN